VVFLAIFEALGVLRDLAVNTKNAPSGIGERIWLQSKDRDDPALSFPVQPNKAHKPDNRSFGCGQALGLGFKGECLCRTFHIGGYFII
jgi:hypothetical protein